MIGKYQRNYYLWGLYIGIFIADDYELFDFMNKDEINSALYGYWIIKR